MDMLTDGVVGNLLSARCNYDGASIYTVPFLTYGFVGRLVGGDGARAERVRGHGVIFGWYGDKGDTGGCAGNANGGCGPQGD